MAEKLIQLRVEDSVKKMLMKSSISKGLLRKLQSRFSLHKSQTQGNRHLINYFALRTSSYVKIKTKS